MWGQEGRPGTLVRVDGAVLSPHSTRRHLESQAGFVCCSPEEHSYSVVWLRPLLPFPDLFSTQQPQWVLRHKQYYVTPLLRTPPSSPHGSQDKFQAPTCGLKGRAINCPREPWCGCTVLVFSSTLFPWMCPGEVINHMVGLSRALCRLAPAESMTDAMPLSPPSPYSGHMDLSFLHPPGALLS